MELSSLVQEAGFRCELWGGFPADQDSTKKRILSYIKRRAMSLGLMPKTMKGKARLKRIFYGKLRRLPEEITENMATYTELLPLKLEGPVLGHKMLYVAAQKK